MCLTSVLIAHPKMKSMTTGAVRVSASVRTSRLSWTNSFTMILSRREPMILFREGAGYGASSRGVDGAQLLAEPCLPLLVHDRDEEILNRGRDLDDRADFAPGPLQVLGHVRGGRAGVDQD